MQNSIYRIIDANFNRSREGLRVLEEYARFILNDKQLTESFKSARHALCKHIGTLNLSDLLDSRDTPGDVGTAVTLASEAKRDNTGAIVKAAAARLSEALRAIEEYAKNIAPEISSNIERLRYQSYELEKQIFARITRKRFDKVKLYVLITAELCKHPPIETARQILEAGTDCIQFREKEMLGQETLDTACAILELCNKHDALLLINDRCDLTAVSNAHGVHLGMNDLPPEPARKIIGTSSIIGRTCHNLDEVSCTNSEDIDYIGIGSIFGSETKPDIPKTGTEFIEQTRKITQHPIVAIGGITDINAADAISAGAQAVAVCQNIISAENPGKAAEKIKTLIQNIQ